MKERIDTVMKWFIWIYSPIILIALISTPECSFFKTITFHIGRDSLNCGIGEQVIPFLDLLILISVITGRYVYIGKTWEK